MSKYIIEVGDAYAEHICGKGDMLCLPVRINEFDDNWMNTNIPLTPYTESDMEKVREEAYEQGKMDAYVEDSKNITMLKKEAEEAYQRGLSDAWAAARWVSKANAGVNFEVFCMHLTSEVLLKISASEAIEKIKAYEQKQEQIQVGDEVRNVKSGWTAVVSNIDGECMTLMDTNGVLGDGYDVNRFTKTGRHFPEIAAVLEKMRGEQDG